MTIYRNHYGSESDPNESTGFSYHSAWRDAKLASKTRTPKNGDKASFAEALRVPCTKKGLVAFLQRYATHPDNG